MLLALEAFFGIGAIGFYLFLLFLSIIFTCAVENDSNWLYFWSAAITVLGVCMYHGALVALALNWQWFVGGFLVYGILGGVWSVIHWFFWCRDKIRDHPFKGNAYREETPEKYFKRLCVAHEHKSEITAWIVFWPWSLFWNVTGRFFKNIYYSLAEVYDRISAAAVARAVRAVGLARSDKPDDQ